MSQCDDIRSLVVEVLDGTELNLKVDSYNLSENLEDGRAKIHCEVHHQKTGERNVIEGEGVGIVDAMFNGLISMYSAEYPSLNTIQFVDFSVQANQASAKESARTDMTAVVSLGVSNSEGVEYVFKDESLSLTQSSIAVVLKGVSFFIDSERAVIQVYRALQHARAENRQDSIQRYTAQLSTLVEATSYSEVIEQIRTSELK